MSHIPSTFAPLNEGWTLTAVNPEAAPEALRATLAAGIPATVPGEATLDLLNAGLITERTRGFYAIYVDMDELAAEGERMVGDDIAEDGIRYLQEINFKDRSSRPVTIAAE